MPAEGGKIYRVDPSSGKRELWNEFRSAEGLVEMHNVLPTPDGKWYVYGHNRSSSDLFLAEGLK